MASYADVARIALSLPAAERARGRLAFAVRTKGKLKEFAWVWMERISSPKAGAAAPRGIS
jgi:hypothetical protein